MIRILTKGGSDAGGALIELALMLMLLCLLLFGVMDFGRVWYHALAVTQAVRAGVQYGSIGLTQANDHSGIIAAAAAAAANDITGFTSNASRTYHCWNGTTDSLMTTASTPSCSGSVRVYVTVTGTKVFTTFLNFPGYPHTITITRTARMRAQ